MRSGFTIIKERDGVKFYGEISASDMERLSLTAFDRRLMQETKYDACAADQLLVLEMIFRRAQEQGL